MITEGQDDGRFARRAVLRLSGIELWERYSFYNMFGLLPLFVAAPVSKGGLGWSGGDALRFFGVYLFSVSVAPLVGGWLTERWLGGRIALRTGTVLLLIGHGLLALAAIIPAWSAWAAAEAMRAAVIAGGGGLAQLAVPVGLPGDQGTAYTAVTCCFYGAIAFVAAGNGLFKPILSVVIGRLPHASPGERESAFTLFFLFVNIGGLFSLVIGGGLQEVAGWSAAFTAAAAGMAIAFVVTVVLEPHYIRPFVARPAPAHDLPPAEPGQRVGWRVPMLLLVVFSTVAAVLSLQSYGFVNLFIDRSVARGIGRFTIPSTWFVALNPVIIMLVTPGAGPRLAAGQARREVVDDRAVRTRFRRDGDQLRPNVRCVTRGEDLDGGRSGAGTWRNRDDRDRRAVHYARRRGGDDPHRAAPPPDGCGRWADRGDRRGRLAERPRRRSGPRNR